MNGPTICRLPCGSARRTEKPSPKSRTRGTMTSSSASQARLSPSTGSVDGIQLMAILRSPAARSCVVSLHPTPLPNGEKGVHRICGTLMRSPLLDERAVVQLGEGLPQLGLGIHHDRTVPGDRLLDRLARDQEKAD